MANDPTIFIIDGSSYLFRAYHALPPLTSPQGEPTGALYGIINMLRKTLLDEQYDRLVMVFDPKGPTTRHGYYADYKANRDEMPEELAVQIAPIHEMIRAMGIPILMMPGIEADDIIGTLAMQAQSAGYHVSVSTGDKDMAQLVGDRIQLVNTMTGKGMDAAGVLDKFGVRPDQIIDYLALIGDTSDHIPGVPKVGPKTAAKWLAHYDNLDAIIAHAGDIKGKVGESLREHVDQIPLSRRLVTIDCAIPLTMTLDECVLGEVDRDTLIKACERYGFHRWLKDYQDGVEAAPNTQPSRQYACILTKADMTAWVTRLQQATHFALDTETDGLDPHKAGLVGLSLAVASGEAAYVPLAHGYEGAPQQLDAKWVLSQLAPLLEDPDRVVVGQNLKFDWHVLARHGLRCTAQMRDTMLASYVCDASQHSHGLDYLASKHLGVTTIHYEDVTGKGKKQLTFDQVPLSQAVPYAAEDADIAWQLDALFWQRIQADPQLLDVYTRIEMPTLRVLAQMEYDGVRIDPDVLRQQTAELKERIDQLTEAIYAEAGSTFNLDSPKQLQKVLYEDLQLPVIKKTPKGQPSTAEPVLQTLALQHGIVEHLLTYRSLTKLRSTYTERLPEQINSRTGRIHTSYNQAVTMTGRLSSTQPNLQNIPIRHAEGRRIRQAFVPQEGCVILAADYSQIELRIMAHLSQDAGLLQAFERGEDVHRATASEVYQVPINAVTDLQRRHAKAINFGLIYGMSAFGLSQQLKTSRDVAQQLMDRYFEKYPGVQAYMDTIRDTARRQGYVETIFGRRLPTPDIQAKQVMLKKAAERAAINAPMQGSAADIIKLAMIRVADWLHEGAYATHMMMQVHDELVFDVPKSELPDMEKNIPRLMSEAAELTVPLEVSVGVGANWDEAH